MVTPKYTAKEVQSALFKHAHPGLTQAAANAEALGVINVMPLEEGIKSILADATEVLHCELSDIDLTSKRQLDVISDVLMHQMRDFCNSALSNPDGNLENSQSSYLQKQ